MTIEYKSGGERSRAVRLYLDELIQVGKKHGFTLSHEDQHGAFIVQSANIANEEWLRDAFQEVKR